MQPIYARIRVEAEEEEMIGVDTSEVGVHAYPEFVTGAEISGGVGTGGGALFHEDTESTGSMPTRPPTA